MATKRQNPKLSADERARIKEIVSDVKSKIEDIKKNIQAPDEGESKDEKFIRYMKLVNIISLYERLFRVLENYKYDKEISEISVQTQSAKFAIVRKKQLDGASILDTEDKVKFDGLVEILDEFNIAMKNCIEGIDKDASLFTRYLKEVLNSLIKLNRVIDSLSGEEQIVVGKKKGKAPK